MDEVQAIKAEHEGLSNWLSAITQLTNLFAASQGMPLASTSLSLLHRLPQADSAAAGCNLQHARHITGAWYRRGPDYSRPCVLHHAELLEQPLLYCCLQSSAQCQIQPAGITTSME